MILSPVLLSACIFLWRQPQPGQMPAAQTPSSPPTPGSSDQAMPLPDLPIRDLPGAPAVAIWSLEPDDQINVSVWRGGKVSSLLVVPRLNLDPASLVHLRVSVSPSARFIAVMEVLGEFPTFEIGSIRIFSSGGDLVWEGPADLPARTTIRWSPDGSRFAIDARARWLVVSPAAAGRSTVVEIDTRRPRHPSGLAAHPWLLLNFAEDGSTLYGADVTGGTPGFRAAVRASASGGKVEPLERLPTEPGLRLAFPPMLSNPYESRIDPQTGRIATHACRPEGDCEVAVRGDGPVRRFILPHGFGGPVTFAWVRGSIVVLYDDDSGVFVQQHLSLFTAGEDFGQERRILWFDVVGNHARLVAVNDDFVLLGFGAGLPEVPSRLFLVRMSDRAGSLLDPDGVKSTQEFFGFAGWVAPKPEPADLAQAAP